MTLPKKREQELVSAPAPLTVGGKTFMVCKPSKKDSLSIYNWAVSHVKKSKPQGLNPDDWKDLPLHLQEVMVKEYAKCMAGKRTLTEQDITEAMLTPAGIAFMIWIGAKKSDSTLKLQDVECLISDENYEQVFADFNDATGIVDEEGQVDPKALTSA